MSRTPSGADTPTTPADDHATARRGGALTADAEGRPAWLWVVVGVVIAAVALGFGAWWTYGLGRGMGGTMAGDAMGGMGVDAPRVPPVAAFYEGHQIAFIHTEASDPAVADMLTDMMDSPVPVVASLARIDPQLLSTVVVFTNGVRPQDGPAGPFGFQPDVFDTAPGDPDYTPLRRVVAATWTEPEQAEVLTSIDAVEDAVDAGLLRLEDTGAVINAPLLTWPGGQR